MEQGHFKTPVELWKSAAFIKLFRLAKRIYAWRWDCFRVQIVPEENNSCSQPFDIRPVRLAGTSCPASLPTWGTMPKSFHPEKKDLWRDIPTPTTDPGSHKHPSLCWALTMCQAQHLPLLYPLFWFNPHNILLNILTFHFRDELLSSQWLRVFPWSEFYWQFYWYPRDT